MALIDLIDVSKKFGPNEILNKISLSINERERIAIIGKNGSGKSTLFMILAGLLAPKSGEMFADDVKITESNLKSYANTIDIFCD